MGAILRMKINKIILTNIGPYAGENIFDFTTNEKQNIILIGGKNGAGKTTLLKALKIGLFGCFSFGFRNENATYFKDVERMLSNQADSPTFKITIDFEYVENLTKYNYALSRSWEKGKDELKEKVDVLNEGKALTELEVDNLINKIRSITSPALINSFIFDGEKIGNIIENGKTKEYIRELFSCIFNIDLLDQFEKDLMVYLNYKDNYTSEEEYELTGQVNKINALKTNIKRESDYYQSLQKKTLDIQIRIQSLQKEFAQIGGIKKDDLIVLQNGIKDIERTAETNNKILRDFYEDYLPFSIVQRNIADIIKKAEAELPKMYGEMLEKVQNYLHVDFSQYIDALCVDKNKRLYELQEDEIEKLKQLLCSLKIKKNVVVKLLSNKESLSNQLMKMRDSLTNNESIERVNEIIQQVAELQKEYEFCISETNAKREQLVDLNKELSLLLIKYNELFEKHKKSRLIGNSYLVCSNTIKTCEQIKKYLIREKLDKIGQTCCSLFNQTIRKKDFISDIKIDENFGLHLFFNGNEIQEDYLSAGETQILVSCLIWSMFKISGRREMFIFDTPLARLDEQNRVAFSQNIVATISGQVVILSTDSEFTNTNYNIIADKVVRKYLLSYDDSKKVTNVKRAYFGDKV